VEGGSQAWGEKRKSGDFLSSWRQEKVWGVGRRVRGGGGGGGDSVFEKGGGGKN